MRAILFVGVGLALAACDRAPRPVHEAVTPTHSVPQGDMCPDITGTFAFEPRSAAARFLVGARRLNQGYSLLRIESTSDGDAYRFTLKASREMFDAAVTQLATRDSARHAEWMERLREREQARKARKSLDVLDEKVAVLGPLPDFMHVVSRRGCVDYWLQPGIDLDARAYADVGDPDPDASYDLELWLARNVAGDLVYRLDRYRVRNIVVDVRTTRSRHFERLAAVDPDRFDWQLDLVPPPQPVEPVPRAELHELVAGVSRVLVSALPPDAEMTRFVPREVDPAAPDATLAIDVSGLARSNADVAAVMRRADAAPGVITIELVSLRVVEETQRVAFEMVITVQAPR